MDAAPALRETHVLCLAPMAAQLGTRERHPAVRAATNTALRLETLALQRRGAIVRVVVPEQADPASMRASPATARDARWRARADAYGVGMRDVLAASAVRSAAWSATERRRTAFESART